MLKEVEDKKAKLQDPGKRYEDGKLVLEYGRYIADNNFKMKRELDTNMAMILIKFIQGFEMIDKLSKEVSKVGDLTNKDVPFTGKKVKDFFESGGSNVVVAGVKKAIEAASSTIEENVSKVEKFITKIEIYDFPDLPFKTGKLQVKKKEGGKRNVIMSLPQDFVSK